MTDRHGTKNGREGNKLSQDPGSYRHLFGWCSLFLTSPLFLSFPLLKPPPEPHWHGGGFNESYRSISVLDMKEGISVKHSNLV